MYYYVLLCITTVCITKYHYLVCITMYYYVLLCITINMYCYVLLLICIAIYYYLVCITLYYYASPPPK